jgi:hypothetical protein
MTDDVRNELDELKRRLDAEIAERAALMKTVLGPIAEVRKDLGLNVDYFCKRIEELASHPGSSEDIVALYKAALQLAKEQDAQRAALARAGEIITGLAARLLRAYGHIDRLMEREGIATKNEATLAQGVTELGVRMNSLEDQMDAARRPGKPKLN